MFRSIRKKLGLYSKHYGEKELENLLKLPYGVNGDIKVFGSEFHFHDARCFYDSYQEIVENEMYRFNAKSSAPYIIDCGANMGLSVLFFAKEYPNAEIVAFEPEPPIYKVLEENIRSFKLKKVTAIKKAVWDSETTLAFYTDKGMGGSVENVYEKQTPVHVETVRLRDYLNKPVDLLKLDIEGAEFTVLEDCKDKLNMVENLFVEYHSFINKDQHLDDLLLMLKGAGFRYHLRQSFSRKKPFIDKALACQNMDMAINVFAYRNPH